MKLLDNFIIKSSREKVKIIFMFLLISFAISSCDSIEPSNSYFTSLSTIQIDKIEVTNNKVVATILVGTPTPCWQYFQTQKSQDESLYTAKIIGIYDGEPCIQITGSFTRKEIITFLSNGEKTLRFWQNDSTYVDTTITL